MEKAMYDKFKKYYFKDINVDDISDDFVNIIVNSNDVFIKYFKEGKGRLQVAEELGVHKNIVGSIMSTNKDKVTSLYDIFKRTNGDVDLVKSLLGVKFLDLYADDIVGLHNKNIKNPLMYARFTKLYFPKLQGKLEKVSKYYIQFVDEMVNRKKFMRSYFKEEKPVKEIADELQITERSLMDKIYWERHNIRKCYERYVKIILEKKNKLSAKIAKK